VEKEALYRFVGRLLPERADVKLLIPPFDYESKDKNFRGTVYLEIIYSQINVIFKTTSEINNINTLKNYIEDSVRLHVDAFGYLNGCGYDIEIIGMLDTNNHEELFSVDFNPIYKKRAERTKNFLKLLSLFNGTEQGNFLQLTFSDLREAIKKPKDTGFFCYRALESICQYFANQMNNSKSNSDVWEIMKSELNYSYDLKEEIKVKSDDIRHGKSVYTSGQDRDKLLEITWDIIDRFVKYLYKKQTNNDLTFD
jgi:hypothetical protein